MINLPMVFPLNTPEDKHLFKLLRNAYVDARYKPSYVITEDRADSISRPSESLKSLM